MKYFHVTAKCGHVSKGYYVEKTFPVLADNKKEAAQKVKQYPRVKKHVKHVITECVEVDQFAYITLREENNKDGYFQSKNKQEQNLSCPDIKLERQTLLADYHKHKVNYQVRHLKENQWIAFARKTILMDLGFQVLKYKI